MLFPEERTEAKAKDKAGMVLDVLVQSKDGRDYIQAPSCLVYYFSAAEDHDPALQLDAADMVKVTLPGGKEILGYIHT